MTTTTTTASLTYLVPNDMRRDDLSALNGAIQRGANVLAASVDDASETRLDAFLAETAEKVAPGLPPPRIVFSGPVFATYDQVTFGVATIGVPALDGVPVDVVRSDMTSETMRAAAQAAERAAFPLRMIQIEPLKPTPEEARLYRELTDRAADEIRRLLCGTLTDSAIDLPPGCEVEYLEADAGEQPGTWALGPVHDGVSEPTETDRANGRRLAIRAAMLLEKVWSPDGMRDATDADRARMVDMLGATPEEVAEALAVPTG